MQIYIVSHRRADKQTTFDNLPSELQQNAKIVVSSDDLSDYRQVYDKAKLLEAPSGIGATRNHIIHKLSKKAGADHLIMLDDDLRFATRSKTDKSKFTAATPAEVKKCFVNVAQLLGRGYVHGAILGREGANRVTADVVHNTRCLRALFYNSGALRAFKVRFDRVPLQEDFDVTLQLLRLGFANAVWCKHVQDQGMSNAPGGCSTYRTMELQSTAAHALHALHPEFVKLVSKKTKVAWNGQERVDVQIQWKKAYASHTKIS